MSDPIDTVKTESQTPPKKSPVSERRQRASRENGRRSKGPKTARGKANSSRNAMKHGLLAREVPNIFMEDQDDFDSLLKNLFKEWRPVGTTEELCVQMIAGYMWRLKRAYRAENGQLTKQKFEVDSELLLKTLRDTEDLRKVTFTKVKREDVPTGATQVPGAATQAKADTVHTQSDSQKTGREPVREHAKVDHMRLTTSNVWTLIDTLRSVTATVEKTGTLSKELKDEMTSRFGTDFGFPEKSLNDGHPIDSSELQRFIKALHTELSSLQNLYTRLFKIEEVDRPALLERASVPSLMAQEKILRYETHILRQLYRAIEELEDLQQRRIERSGAPTLEVAHQHNPRIAGFGRKSLELRSRNI